MTIILNLNNQENCPDQAGLEKVENKGTILQIEGRKEANIHGERRNIHGYKKQLELTPWLSKKETVMRLVKSLRLHRR